MNLFHVPPGAGNADRIVVVDRVSTPAHQCAHTASKRPCIEKPKESIDCKVRENLIIMCARLCCSRDYHRGECFRREAITSCCPKAGRIHCCISNTKVKRLWIILVENSFHPMSAASLWQAILGMTSGTMPMPQFGNTNMALTPSMPVHDRFLQ